MKSNLQQSLVKKMLIYSRESGEFTWRTDHGRNGKAGERAEFNAVDGKYLAVTIFGEKHLAHRLAWFYVHGTWPSDQIDHINGIGTDNRISNLREADNGQNQQNLKKARKHNKSGLLGAHYHAKSGNFVAQITHNKQKYTIGSFRTAEEAHAAYLKAKSDLHDYNTLQPPTINQLNRLGKKIGKTNHAGIECRPTGKLRFRASYWRDGRKFHVGAFQTLEDAVKARERAINLLRDN